jgi:hypothetical protein
LERAGRRAAVAPNSAGIIGEVNKSGREHIRIDDTVPINFVHGAGMPLTSLKMGGDADAGQYLIPPALSSKAPPTSRTTIIICW